mmetsp:Transcript_78909/g.176839  ORF Transcript_78909/g.176839 Transcript_78909/m.176839 type:complete len:253 (+) Transcript_78909:1053-1811(+)
MEYLAQKLFVMSTEGRGRLVVDARPESAGYRGASLKVATPDGRLACYFCGSSEVELAQVEIHTPEQRRGSEGHGLHGWPDGQTRRHAEETARCKAARREAGSRRKAGSGNSCTGHGGTGNGRNTASSAHAAGNAHGPSRRHHASNTGRHSTLRHTLGRNAPGHERPNPSYTAHRSHTGSRLQLLPLQPKPHPSAHGVHFGVDVLALIRDLDLSTLVPQLRDYQGARSLGLAAQIEPEGLQVGPILNQVLRHD